MARMVTNQKFSVLCFQYLFHRTFHWSLSLHVCDALVCKTFYFGLFPGKPMILSLQNFNLMNSGFLDYQSRQLGPHYLISYHPNLILTIFFSFSKFDHVRENFKYAPVNYCHKELHLWYCGSPRSESLEQVPLAALL